MITPPRTRGSWNLRPRTRTDWILWWVAVLSVIGVGILLGTGVGRANARLGPPIAALEHTDNVHACPHAVDVKLVDSALPTLDQLYTMGYNLDTTNSVGVTYSADAHACYLQATMANGHLLVGMTNSSVQVIGDYHRWVGVSSAPLKAQLAAAQRALASASVWAKVKAIPASVPMWDQFLTFKVTTPDGNVIVTAYGGQN